MDKDGYYGVSLSELMRVHEDITGLAMRALRRRNHMKRRYRQFGKR